MAVSTSTVTNHDKRVCDKLVVIEECIKIPIIQDTDVMSPHTFMITQGLQQLTEERPCFSLINLIDLLGKNKSITFNRIRFAARAALGPAQVQVGLYKLTPTATFGDASTYKANSKKIFTSSFLTITQDLMLMHDIETPLTTLKTFDSEGKENHYFFAIMSLGNAGVIVAATTTLDPPSATPAVGFKLYEFIYTDEDLITSLPLTMGTYSRTSVMATQYLYFTLWRFN